MPDLTIEYMYQCESLTRTSVTGSKGDTYHLYNHRGRGWQCTCKGFQFRGTCKHVKQVEAEGCQWHQFTHDGEPVEVNGEKVCPECGAPVEVIKFAV